MTGTAAQLFIATILVDPANTPARNAYITRGGTKIGELQPIPDSPRFDSTT